MLALTSTPAPPDRRVRAQFLLVTSGAGLIALGMPTSTEWVTAVGGIAFVAAMAILGWMLRTAWRRALNRRHSMPIAAYGCAIASVLLGGAIGAWLGSGAASGSGYLELKQAHMTANVLGWASLTVVGTLITLLPTVLRLRMPPWPGRAVLTLLVTGLILQLAGRIGPLTWLMALGGATYALGALGMILLVASVLRAQRTWAIPAAAFHMMSAIAWFVAGSIGLAVALLDGVAGFDRYRPVFLTAFVAGWLVQVLLGAWSYLLPMGRPGHPDERRRSLAAFEALAPVQVVLLNGGLLLLAGRAAGWLGPALADVGVVAALAGGGMALVKSWLFPILGRGPVDTERARAVWGG